MKVVRVIKWIAFVVFILAFALNLVANGFILADVALVAKETSNDAVFSWQRLSPDENDLRMSDVKTYLADNSFGFDNLRAPLAPYAETISNNHVDQTEEPVVTEGPAISLPQVPVPTENITDNVDQPAEADEPTETNDFDGVASSGSMAYDAYDVTDHCNLVFGVMKYGSASGNFEWLTKPIGLDNTSISISFFVAMVALLLAFILHVISKRYKTVYGTILMIIGFIFFYGLLLIGVMLGDAVIYNLQSLETTDTALCQFVSIVALGILGTLIGLPIYSCGIRQITNKRLRRRLRRKANH